MYKSSQAPCFLVSLLTIGKKAIGGPAASGQSDAITGIAIQQQPQSLPNKACHKEVETQLKCQLCHQVAV